MAQSLNKHLNIREALESGLKALAQETARTLGAIAVLHCETGDIELDLACGYTHHILHKTQS